MRSKVILLLAIVMGAVTTFLFYHYMKQFNAETVAMESMVDVVAAKDSIEANRIVSQDQFILKKVPEASLHPNTLKDLAAVEGKFTTSEIAKGEVILSHRLKTKEEETDFVSKKVTEGYRAVSVASNFVQSVSNLIEPEDYVDVVFTEARKGGNGEVVMNTEQILAKVRVLAIGRKMVEGENSNEKYVEYSSVTLELKPKDAVKVINASERGNISLTLHSKLTNSK